jgi:hypothetical protein
MVDEDWDISICGLNCARCDIYEASHGADEKRAEILTWFKEKRGLDLKPEQIRCEGCRCPPEQNWSKDCNMLLCATEKRHRYCFECACFPCQHLERFASDGVDHHKRTVENLCAMKRLGLGEWIHRHDVPSFCP